MSGIEQTEKEIDRAKSELAAAQARLTGLEERLKLQKLAERTRELELRGWDWARECLSAPVKSARVTPPTGRADDTWYEEYEFCLRSGTQVNIVVRRRYGQEPGPR